MSTPNVFNVLLPGDEGYGYPVQVTETYSDLQGPLTKDEYELGGRRIAALVALCEEVLDAYDDLPLPDSYRNPDNFRERLAQLKGEA